jgi:hypothetical protein
MRQIVSLFIIAASSIAVVHCASKSNSAKRSDSVEAQGADTDAGCLVDGAAGKAGTIVPLYTYPTDPSWTAIAAAKRNHPSVEVIAIANPNSGPGAAQDANYTNGILALQAAGIKVIGYVHSSYGSRPAADVQADMDLWKQFYPSVSGIMIDEMGGTAGQESYYALLTAHARAHGFSMTVGNPGQDIGNSFVGTVDTVFIYENSGLPQLTSLANEHAGLAPSNFALIPYNVAALDKTYVQSAGQAFRYIYLTNDNLPNPWDSLSNYFDDLLGALE